MHPYNHVVSQDGEQTLTVLDAAGGAPIVVNGDHPDFDEILELAQSDCEIEDIREIADLALAAANRLNYLSERVAVSHGAVYFDGDEVDNALTQQIRRLLDSGESEDGWAGLVNFMERLAANPSKHSQTQLYDWLRDRDFTITAEGNLVGYKGVSGNDDIGYRSLHAGGAIVNGERVDGVVPQKPGDLVELPRSAVQEDSAVGCSTGLHVGTYEYAKDYARNGALLKVLVNPRDVVSVPTDCNAEKLRCCRYEVVEVIDTELGKITEPVIFDQAKHTAVAFG